MAEGAPAVGLACAVCSALRPKESFSKNQLLKKLTRKCRQCVEKQNGGPSAKPMTEEEVDKLIIPDSNTNNKTRFPALQQQLKDWVVMLAEVDGAAPGERKAAVLAFTKTFVPLDLTEDDFEHFSSGLAEDAAWFASLSGEVRTCASGAGVTELKETKNKESVFGFKGLTGSDNIFREVVFIFSGGKWRAEG